MIQLNKRGPDNRTMGGIVSFVLRSVIFLLLTLVTLKIGLLCISPSADAIRLAKLIEDRPLVTYHKNHKNKATSIAHVIDNDFLFVRVVAPSFYSDGTPSSENTTMYWIKMITDDGAVTIQSNHRDREYLFERINGKTVKKTNSAQASISIKDIVRKKTPTN